MQTTKPADFRLRASLAGVPMTLAWMIYRIDDKAAS
jgi:hypothetical protein